MHSLDKAPFFEIVEGMPYFNALFAFFWYQDCEHHHQNMYQYLVPDQGHSMAVLFQRKLSKADGTPSDEFLINENLIALFHFHVVCALDASVTAKRSKKAYYNQQIAYYRAL